MQEIYKEAEIIKDIGSGLNFKRKGLQAILERLLQGDKLRLVVAHKDRLARFGFDIIQFLVTKNGGEILVLDEYLATSKEAELTADLLSILHHFSCKMHGSRSNKNKKDKDLSDYQSEKNISELVRDFKIHIQQNYRSSEVTKGGKNEELDDSRTENPWSMQ